MSEVIGETELHSFPLSGGSRDTWVVNDVYDIYPNVQCAITGGNLVAIDAVGAELSPVIQSPNVQVVRSSSSSATLQELGSIQYSSFNGGVTVDISNGVPGTAFPIGTPRDPVDNLTDAATIADSRGFTTFFINGDLTIGSSGDYEGLIFIGESTIRSEFTIESSANVLSCEFYNAKISGVLDGNCVLSECLIDDLDYFYGVLIRCILDPGTITLGGNNPGIFLDCWSGQPGASLPTINCGGSGQSLSLQNYNGRVKITGKTGADVVNVALNAGEITIDSTVTGGTVNIDGVGSLIDNSTGTTTVNYEGLISPAIITKSVWSECLAPYGSESVGWNMKTQTFDGDVILDTSSFEIGTEFPVGTRNHPVNNLADALTICDANNIKRIRLRSDLTIAAGQDVSGMAIETRGLMGTEVTLAVGCSTNNTTFRYVNLQGTVNNSDVMLVESCTVLNLANFSGVMQGVALGQGSEISIGAWAEMYNCRAGGDPGNEPEISIGNSALNIQQYRGNLKVKDKTGSNRTVIGGLPTVLIIDATCVAGIIQLIGIGNVEQDNSGPGCQVDYDAALTVDTIVTGINEAVIEGTLTDIETKRLALSILTGLCSGGGTANIAFRDLADTKDRVTATVDIHGNRSAVTLDGN